MTQHSRLGLASSLASLTLISASAAAQSVTRPPANGQQPLEEIIVKATKIERPLDHVPSAASVVGQDDIQYARQQLGLDEALNRVPGMFMQNRYNFAQDLRISIRGFGARAQFGIRGVKVLVDGIPETLPDGESVIVSEGDDKEYVLSAVLGKTAPLPPRPGEERYGAGCVSGKFPR